MSLFPLDGPSRQFSISLTTATVQEVKVGTPYSERKLITIQPLSSDIWVYFGDGVNTPSAVTVAVDGFKHFNLTNDSYEESEGQQIFILAVTTTTSVRIAERS